MIMKTIYAFVCAIVLAGSAQAMSTPVDLNDFFADPTVIVELDGSSAMLSEDPGFSMVLLSNDPGLFDPNIIIPGPGVQVVFEFDFVEDTGNDDEFSAFIIDAITGLPAGPAFEFFIDASASGSFAFDISSLTGKTLGLQFQLSALFGDTGFGSTARVSNVHLLEAIPEPSDFALLSAGMVAMGFYVWRRKSVAAR